MKGLICFVKMLSRLTSSPLSKAANYTGLLGTVKRNFVRNFNFRPFRKIFEKPFVFSLFEDPFYRIFAERFNERAAHYREQISSVNAFLQIYFKKVTRANFRLPTWQT